MTKAEKMDIKEFRLPPSTISSLERLAQARDTTPSEVICQAVDAYRLLHAAEMESSDLMELISARQKQTLDSILRTRREVEQALQMLDSGDEPAGRGPRR